LAKAISEHYKCSLQTAVDAVKYAEKFAYSDFPKKEDLLAVMAVESKFNPNASFRGSKGVMQVLVKTHKDKVVYPFTFEEQTRTGARILRENFLSLNNSSSAAVMAYNIGLGAYQKGRKSRHYLAKFNTQLAWIKSQERGPRLV
jgi:soluble lytic murein transglycosylase-like protein